MTAQIGLRRPQRHAWNGPSSLAHPAELQTGVLPQYIFSVRADRRSGPGSSNKRFRSWLASRSRS